MGKEVQMDGVRFAESTLNRITKNVYAFPRQLPNVGPVSHEEAISMIDRYSGMALEDYYAGEIAAAIISTLDPYNAEKYDGDFIAEESFNLAASLMKVRAARAKQKEEAS